MNVSVNWLAVLVAIVANFILGSLWYGPIFGKTWTKLLGLSRESLNEMKKKGMAKSYILMLVGTFLTAYILSHVVAYSSAYNQMTGWMVGFQTGFWVWLGFIVPITWGAQLWEGKPWKLFCINAGYSLISLLIMGSIIACWM